MATMPPSQYLLRWNERLTNYGDMLFSLREQEEYVDCSIACEDGFVGAHRVVLAGCSSYLRDLFARVSTPHPVIFLINTPRSLVLMLMEFMYRGQVHIPQQQLQQLLMLGHALKIKGLTQIMFAASQQGSTTTTTRQEDMRSTPLAFPHGLPLSTASTAALPFTAMSQPCNMDVSLLSFESDPTAEERVAEEGLLLERNEEREVKEEEEGSNAAKKNEENRVKESDKCLSEPTTPASKVRRPKGRPRKKPLLEKDGGDKKLVAASQVPQYSYLSNRRDKLQLAVYTTTHGISSAQRYILKKYNIHARQKTLEHLLQWYKQYLKAIEIRKKKPRKASKTSQT